MQCSNKKTGSNWNSFFLHRNFVFFGGCMRNYIIRTRIIFSLLIIITLFLTLYGIFLPMEREIENNLVENFNLLAQTKTDSFYGTINKNVQGAKSLSSRTVIRNKITEYLQGEIDFYELKNFTEDKYLDGVRAIENVAYSIRIVDQQVVSEYYGEQYVDTTVKHYESNDELSYTLAIKGDIYCLEVVSPIFNVNEIIGHDLVGFCLNSAIDSLNTGTVEFMVSENKMTRQKVQTYDNTYEDDTNVYFSIPLDDQYEITISQSKEKLFESRDHLTKRSIVYIVLAYLIISIIVYIFIIKYSKKKIQDLSVDRDTYKNHADKDALTNANSRLFFNDFIKNHPYESGLLILIDLDNFKIINDLHGHLIGDEVLKTVVSVFKSSIRNDDLIIRYGGDEFLLILRNDFQNNGLETVARIEKKLSEEQNFEFPIEFSYGISHIESMKQINVHIKEADIKMYNCKKRKRFE